MRNAALVGGAIAIGVLVAALQGMGTNTAQFVGAALAPAILGGVIGGVRRLFGKTDVFNGPSAVRL